jgi:uncharacterized membrane protein (UPF0127 family)
VERFRDLPVTSVLGFEVPVATTRRSRLIGLAFLDRDEAGDGLLIRPCRSVHTFGMRFELDLVFLDSDRRVVEVRREVGPNRVIRCQRADSVLELPAPSSQASPHNGRISGTNP